MVNTNDDLPEIVRLPEGVKTCSRCGGSHEHVIFSRRLARPVYSFGKNPQLVGTHWFPCPSNFEPVIVLVGPLDDVREYVRVE